MVIMFKMSAAKKEKMLGKLEKMESFIEEFKECLENAEVDDDAEYRDGHSHLDHEEEMELKKLASRYLKMKKMGM